MKRVTDARDLRIDLGRSVQLIAMVVIIDWFDEHNFAKMMSNCCWMCQYFLNVLFYASIGGNEIRLTVEFCLSNKDLLLQEFHSIG